MGSRSQLLSRLSQPSNSQDKPMIHDVDVQHRRPIRFTAVAGLQYLHTFCWPGLTSQDACIDRLLQQDIECFVLTL